MPWTAPTALATGDVVTETIWDNQVEANLNFLSTHGHSGIPGDGSTSLGNLVRVDFTTAVAPAAPGASLVRLYAVTGDLLGIRVGAAGAAQVVVTRDATETLTAKTLTSPVVNTQLTGTAVGAGASQVAAGDHTHAASGVARAGGNTTEATTTSTGAVDLRSITGLSIAVGTPVKVVFVFRKTAQAFTPQLGLKLNATQVLSNNAGMFTAGAAAENGYAEIDFIYGVASYLRGGTSEWRNPDASTFRAFTTDMPTATLTDIVITGLSGDASQTLAVDEVHVYTYPVS